MACSEGKHDSRRRAGGITRTVNAAFLHHQAGRLDRAESLYRKALERDPEQAEALHLLGVIAYQRGNIGAAIGLIERALPALQDLAEVHLNLGNALRGAGRLTEAADSYRRAIALVPDYGMAHCNLARVMIDHGLFEAGLESSQRALELMPDFFGAHVNYASALFGLERSAEAEVPLRQALDLMPDRAEAYGDLARVLAALGRLDDAMAIYRRAITLEPNCPEAHSSLGALLHAQDRLDEAVASYRQAVQLRPNDPVAHFNLGNALQAHDRLDEAVMSYGRAVHLKPDLAEAHNNLGNALQLQSRLDDAVSSYRRALAIRPNYVEAHVNLGVALEKEGSLDDAVMSYRRALALSPKCYEGYYNLGNILKASNRLDEAVENHRRAIRLKPDFVEAHNNLGNLLKEMGELDEAVVSFQRALAVAPDCAPAHNSLGVALQAQNRLDDAVASYGRALVLEPNFAEAHYNLGYALKGQGRLTEAVASFAQVIALKPEHSGALAAWFHERQHICDWSNYCQNEARVRNAIGVQPSLGTAFTLLALSSTPEEQFNCARRAAAKIAVPASATLPRHQSRRGERIRLGYLSADLYEHATAYLIAGLIEHHDRRHFEVVAYSYGPDDESPMRARLTGAFDRFVDIGKMPHRQAAGLIHANAVDILIDLKGFTRNSRTAILAYRPAPVHVHYLGYPSTTGADFVDYFIVDRFVVPPDQQPYFSERLVHLPDAYQCNDDKRPIAEQTPLRAASGLPEADFVFCCFNNTYKITPTFFDIWMRLLRAVPGSILWLLDANPWAKANLLCEAAARGIAPERLVFAPWLALPEHLARHRLANLFLDTLPVNAHTMASDALWAGLPVLTCAGNTFAGRVAGSLLRAIGLGELVTTSLEEYEALALRLAREPARLARLRARLAQNRLKHPLFDTARFTRNLEVAYRRMWETWSAGRPPIAFSVSPTTNSAQ
jgi:protein O-GlcNAc transferase